ncbi:hypothetical protein MASR1M29_15460 [Cloacibacterium normanense]
MVILENKKYQPIDKTNMRKNLKSAFIISLVTNLIFIVLIGYIGYSKRFSIILRFKNIFKKETVISNNQLKSMNNVSIPVFTEFCNNKSGKKFKILIIGNSLSYHKIVEEIGWNHISGMAATSIEKDYAHLLYKKIENKMPDRNICMRISNFAKFERNLPSFDDKSIDSLVNFQPDIIIFQLGENVAIEEQNVPLLFEQEYIELINRFKKKGNPLMICTTPFFPSLEKNKIIEKVALSTNIYMVDLSHLPLLESENYAKDEKKYLGDKSVWKVDGIGIHPGDIGMKNIANQLFITINASLFKSEIAKKQ